MLPLNIDPTTGLQRTSRDIINILCDRFGIHDFSAGQHLKEVLFYTPPKSQEQVPEFVSEWQKQLNILVGAQYLINWAESISRFLTLLPLGPTWEPLRLMGSDAMRQYGPSLNRESWEYFVETVLQADTDRRTQR
ncbi:hypothetical protein PM082_022106 [Marasmius tenuissimus]|nr:hypothetical protein PM082_022106 [Marasmius tenuissimus]